VLGSGGVAGIAWETGVVAGLDSLGVGLRRAEVLVGTSAGAVVAVRLAGDVPTGELYERACREPEPAEQSSRYSQAAAHAASRRLFARMDGDVASARRHIGARAMELGPERSHVRLAMTRDRLGTETWPAGDVRLVAMDALTGERHVLCAGDAALVEAVAASCAVPRVWPAVPVAGRPLVDGGLYSMTNADVAIDAKRVLVISPSGFGDENPICGRLRHEVDLLQQRGRTVLTIVPDQRSARAMGDSVLDPAAAPPSARAGYAQGRTAARRVAEFWDQDV
jgi:NTE family protein